MPDGKQLQMSKCDSFQLVLYTNQRSSLEHSNLESFLINYCLVSLTSETTLESNLALLHFQGMVVIDYKNTMKIFICKCIPSRKC